MNGLYSFADGELRFHFHPGQQQAWDSERRVIAIIAGRQSGKTSYLPLWLWREIIRCGPGDYGFVCPTFTLMEKKALPEFVTFFDDVLGLGKYVGSSTRKFTVSREGSERLFGHVPQVKTHVYFGYAENPDSLESATYKAAALDEAGQKAFKLDSYHAIRGRLALHRGRLIIGTTPYTSLGWLKSQIYDPWTQGDRDIEVIQFASTMNPMFSVEEFENLRNSMPEWKFRLYYEGRFSKPAGLIYDCFDDATQKVPAFRLPDSWPRYGGLDFGGVNTAAVFAAMNPADQRLYIYREYHAGQRTARGHTEELLKGENAVPVFIGGSKSEGQWRSEFAAAGLPVLEPKIHEVEVGIDRVYGAFKRGEVFIFNTCEKLLEELATYSRKLDENGEPTEQIEEKETFHVLDSVRYLLGYLKSPQVKLVPSSPSAVPSAVEALPRGVFGGPATPGASFGGPGGSGSGGAGGQHVSGKRW